MGIFIENLQCVILQKREHKTVCFWHEQGWGSNLCSKIKTLPFIHEDVLDLYSEQLRSCKAKMEFIWREIFWYWRIKIYIYPVGFICSRATERHKRHIAGKNIEGSQSLSLVHTRHRLHLIEFFYLFLHRHTNCLCRMPTYNAHKCTDK